MPGACAGHFRLMPGLRESEVTLLSRLSTGLDRA
jgi:hypothetical protein